MFYKRAEIGPWKTDNESSHERIDEIPFFYLINWLDATSDWESDS